MKLFMDYYEEDLEVMDPLKALKDNATRLKQMKEAKILLMGQALEQGYNWQEIGQAIGQTDQGARMFAKRNEIVK